MPINRKICSAPNVCESSFDLNKNHYGLSLNCYHFTNNKKRRAVIELEKSTNQPTKRVTKNAHQFPLFYCAKVKSNVNSC